MDGHPRPPLKQDVQMPRAAMDLATELDERESATEMGLDDLHDPAHLRWPRCEWADRRHQAEVGGLGQGACRVRAQPRRLETRDLCGLSRGAGLRFERSTLLACLLGDRDLSSHAFEDAIQHGIAAVTAHLMRFAAPMVALPRFFPPNFTLESIESDASSRTRTRVTHPARRPAPSVGRTAGDPRCVSPRYAHNRRRSVS